MHRQQMPLDASNAATERQVTYVPAHSWQRHKILNVTQFKDVVLFSKPICLNDNKQVAVCFKGVVPQLKPICLNDTKLSLVKHIKPVHRLVESARV